MTSLGQGPNVSDTQVSSYVRVKLAIARNFHFQGGGPRSPPWSPQRPFLAILVVFSGYRGPDSKRRVPLRSASRASSFEYPHAILSRIFVLDHLFGPKRWTKTKKFSEVWHVGIQNLRLEMLNAMVLSVFNLDLRSLRKWPK